MAKHKMCERCGQRPAVIHFCNECAREINDAHEHIMERAVAARAYFNTMSAGTGARQCEVFAFLQIVHPEIPGDKAMRIARATD